MFQREIREKLIEYNRNFPIVSVTGPRQSGKTTLCKMVFPGYEYMNLEDEESRDIVKQDIKGFLRKYGKGLVIDEVHRLPEIFSALQIVADEDDSRRYVISGSSNWLMMENISQSLAGRVALLRLLPLSLKEIGVNHGTNELLHKGFYPAIWGKNRPVSAVYDSYFSTYIQRDVRQIINIKDMDLFRKFVRLCATRVGSEFIASSLASEVGVSVKTIQGWLSVLETSYIVYLLPPFYRNIGKRLVKSPKLYFCDVGLACYLLGLKSENDVSNSPLRGALFENLIIMEFVKKFYNKGLEPPAYFYRDKSQHEIDLLLDEGGLSAYEIKSATAFNSDFVKNLNYLDKVIEGGLKSRQVIYDGEKGWDKPDNGFMNFRDLKFFSF